MVKVTDQKHLEATTLALTSDIEAIVRTSREQMLIFAQDMKTGKGRPRARVLVSDAGAVVLEAETGPDGVLLHDWSPPHESNRRLTYLVLDGGHVAGSGLGVPDKLSQRLTARAYLYTDRPAYRPGQQVAVRGVIREVQSGQYANVPRAGYRFGVTDSRGRQIIARPVTLSDFGTFHETLPLDRGAPVGTYRVRVYQPGKSDFAGFFEVQSYQLKPINLSFDLKQTVYYRGETVEADIVAKYQYGAPVANRPIRVTLPDQRVVNATTDATGKFHVTFSTDGFAEEQALRLVARLPQDNVAAAAAVMLAIRGFNIGVHTSREVYLDGESFPVQVNSSDARGEPTGQRLSAAVIKMVNALLPLYTRKELKVPEVSVVRPLIKPAVAQAADPARLNAPGDRAGLRAVGVQPPVANPAGGQDLLAKPGNNLKQIQRLQERYKSPESDKAKGAPAGQFR